MNIEQYKGGLYGHFIGDALGVPFEFRKRELRDQHPCTDMVGYGSHNMPRGTWSDDTSMTIAGMDGLAVSLENGNEDYESISELVNYGSVMYRYWRWFRKSDYTPYGRTWGVGYATYDAITRYSKGREPLLCGGVGERDNGNGSVMRALPIAIFVHHLSQATPTSIDEKMEIFHNFASLTHRHKRSQMACGIYCLIALEIMEDKADLEASINNAIDKAIDYYSNNPSFKEEYHHFDRIFSKNIGNLERDEIKSGGYVISTVEASIWCLLNNNNYKDTVLEAVNLGYDADTTACSVGALAGLHYGYGDIPKEWLDSLVHYDYIDGLVEKFTTQLSQRVGGE